MAKLLIIGNGFDLHCGLKSTYNDFFNYLKEIEPFYEVYKSVNKNEISDTPKGKRINIWWALLIAYHKEENSYLWKDIENIMAAFLYQPTEEYKINLEDILNNFNQRRERLLNEWSTSNITTTESIMRFLWLLMRGNNLEDFYNIKYTLRTREQNIVTKDINDVISLIKKDLNEIEENFVEYLKSIHGTDSKIHKNANEAYLDLLQIKNNEQADEKRLEEVLSEELNDCNILSFNYTRLGQPNGVNYKNFKNIHGTFLGNYNDIIFGIDSFDMSATNPLYIFTKTYRLTVLENKLKNIPDIFDGKINLNNINEIYIYGHSLDKQDYSYFYAIFNKAEINNRDTKITLFYSDFGGVDRSQERALSLMQLIRNYETEFSKPKGLYHRMLIEGRIGLSKI